ncbi:MAG: hypothetical protein ACJ8AH_20350, partial [Stellaceae bacterium]
RCVGYWRGAFNPLTPPHMAAVAASTRQFRCGGLLTAFDPPWRDTSLCAKRAWLRPDNGIKDRAYDDVRHS